MYDLKTIRAINWRKVRDGCERTKRPMSVDHADPPITVAELPEIPIAWVDHGAWELVHLRRLPKAVLVNTLREGYWTVVPGMPYCTHVTLLKWEIREKGNPHDEMFCRACRLSCGCGCKGDMHKPKLG